MKLPSASIIFWRTFSLRSDRFTLLHFRATWTDLDARSATAGVYNPCALGEAGTCGAQAAVQQRQCTIF